MDHDVLPKRIPIVAAGLALLLAGTARAQPEIELSNDGWTPGGGTGFQAGFVVGEMAASRFVPDDPAQLLRIRFLFGGGSGTATQTVTVHVWDDAPGTDAPGTELYSNDFVLTPDSDTLQEIEPTDGGAIDVTGPFRVGLEFHHAGLPSVARDDDGLDFPDRNFIDASGAGWMRSSAGGLTGDWILRAVISGPTAADADADADVDAEEDADADAEEDAEPDAEAGADADGDAEADGAVTCVFNAQCPAGQYCGPAGVCIFDCVTDDDCPASAPHCDILGQCVGSAPESGCGCRLAARTGVGAPFLLGLAAAVAVLRRRRRSG